MVLIYCIEDINDLKYIGSTTQRLGARLAHHRYNRQCSSRELNLYNCIIYELENCSQEERKEREKYHINHTECVNTHKLNHNNREACRTYYEKNKEKQNEQRRQHRLDNIELYKKRDREKYMRNKEKINKKKRENYMRNKQKKLNAV